jgi:hypothetical protein
MCPSRASHRVRRASPDRSRAAADGCRPSAFRGKDHVRLRLLSASASNWNQSSSWPAGSLFEGARKLPLGKGSGRYEKLFITANVLGVILIFAQFVTVSDEK